MSRSRAHKKEVLAALQELVALSRRMAEEIPRDANPALAELQHALACAEVSAARLAADRIPRRRA